MGHTRIAFLIWLVGIWFLSIGPAYACTCMAPPTAAEALQKSSAVFRGRVVTIYRSFLDRVGITNTAGYRVQFEITKQWKGTPAKSIVVITRITGEACGFPFEEKKEYLVYVVTEPKDIQTGICTGTKNIAEAEEEMKQLDKLLQTNRKNRDSPAANHAT
jgi:hypothetical protein